MKKWPSQDVYFWDKATFFRLLLPLVAGIATYDVFHTKVRYILFSTLVFFIVYVIAAYIKKQTVIVRTIHFASLHILVAAVGWILCYFSDVRNDEHWFGVVNSEAYVARIIDAPAEKERTWKLKVEVIDAVGKCATSGKAYVYVYKNRLPLLFHEGDTIILPAKWQKIKTAGNPFEFDYARYCALNNIFYQQFIASDEVLLYGLANPEFFSLLRRVHLWCMYQLGLYIHDKQTLGLIQAILIGDEANLDSELRQAYAETGIVHIIAISGSHITFFFFFISFLLKWIKHNRWKWLKYIAALPLIWAYVVMAGAPPSAVRAALMFSVFAVGLVFEKQPNGLNQLLATAFLLLVAEPNWLYAIGFQLSFIAVLSLILFYKPIYNLYKPANTILKGIWAAITVSLAAEILVAPLVVYYFHLLPVWFIIANVLAYLFMGIVLVAGMCLVVLGQFATIAKAIAMSIEWMVQLFNKLVYAMQEMSPKSFNYLQINLVELTVAGVVIVGIALFLMQKQKKSLFVSLAATCILLLLLCKDEWDALQQRKLIVYNMTRGNHIELIEGINHYILYSDTSINPRTKMYALKSAHTGYHSMHQKEYKDQKELFVLNGQTVLILNSHPRIRHNVHADYVILNYRPNKVNPLEIQHLYNPKQIVLGSNVSRKQISEWVEACNRLNIGLYPVAENGAFVL